MPDQYDIIIRDLALIRASGGSLGIFGEGSHGYSLNPALSGEEVAAFEAETGVRFPGDYRQFLIRVGNGGAGPYYGLFKLGQMDDGFDYGPWTDYVGALSSPFRHQGPWNNLTGKPDNRMPVDSDEYDLGVAAFEKHYFAPHQINGAIPICHLGCARRHLLVVAGPEAGYIWSDDRAEYKGLSPLSSPSHPRTTFYQWYRNWLDEALAKAQVRVG